MGVFVGVFVCECGMLICFVTALGSHEMGHHKLPIIINIMCVWVCVGVCRSVCVYGCGMLICLVSALGFHEMGRHKLPIIIIILL